MQYRKQIGQKRVHNTNQACEDLFSAVELEKFKELYPTLEITGK
jgi:hypothetical protein